MVGRVLIHNRRSCCSSSRSDAKINVRPSAESMGLTSSNSLLTVGPRLTGSLHSHSLEVRISVGVRVLSDGSFGTSDRLELMVDAELELSSFSAGISAVVIRCLTDSVSFVTPVVSVTASPPTSSSPAASQRCAAERRTFVGASDFRGDNGFGSGFSPGLCK